MVGPRLDEHGSPLTDRNLLVLHLEDTRPFDHDVELVVLVRLLLIRLGRDEHVHPDLEAGGLVDDLVATAGLTEPLLDRCDLERVH